MAEMEVEFMANGWVTRRHFTALGALSVFCGHGDLRAQAPAKAAKANRSPKILVVGDSLSAEYGLKRGTGWVALLTARLATGVPTAQVVNASISGDTTSGGRSRLPRLLSDHQPTHVVIELGGNDALRGLPISMSRDNLTAMTRAAQAAGAQVLLLGMQMPPNYGAEFARQFEAIFPQVAKANKAAVVPFFLKGVADNPADPLRLFQADRIHPTEAAHPIMLNNVWPELAKLLK